MLQTDIIKVRKITLIKIILFSQIYKFIYNKTKNDPMSCPLCYKVWI